MTRPDVLALLRALGDELAHTRGRIRAQEDWAARASNLAVDLDAAKERIAELEAENLRLRAAALTADVRRILDDVAIENMHDHPTRPERAMLRAWLSGAKAGPAPEPARLDADGTATGKTILTAPIVTSAEGTSSAGPATMLVNAETRERTALGAAEVDRLRAAEGGAK